MFWFGLVLASLSAIFIAWWLTRARLKCPECGSQKIRVTGKEPLDSHTVDYHSGGPGGGYTSVQTAYKVTYRCGQCRASWQKTITESR